MKIQQSPLYLLLVFALFQACQPTQEVVQFDESVNLDTIDIEPPKPKVYQAAETRVNDLIHTKLEVSFDWDSTYLYGKAFLTFSPYFYEVDSLILDAKGFQLHEVALLNKIGEKSPLQYSYDSSFIHIALDKIYQRTDTFQVFIDYTAMPNKLDAGGSAAITSDKGLYFINPDGSDPDKPKQIWTQGETEASSCWFPTIDSPNEKTTQEIYITVDSNYVTLSNGALMFQTENEDGTHTDYWKQELPHAPYLFMMAIGDFAVVKDEWRDKPVHYYVEHKYEAFAKDIYPNTPEMLEFFSKRLDYDYPWDKFHQVVVRDYVSGAMENTGAVIYGDFVQGDDRFLIDNSAEDIVAHEMFHHWFGDLVTCESWANLPLNEAFATYGEYLWNEHKYGKDQADYHGYNDLRVYLQSARTAKKKLIRFDYDHRMEMFDAHSYQKGGRVLHMLRNYVGDDAFFTALNLYLKDNEFQPAEIHHLRLAFEEITGEDLNWFFNQWFLKAGHPKIEIEREFVDSTKTLTLELVQTQEGDEIPAIFEIYTDVEIVKANGEKVIEPIHMTQREQSFTFTLEKAPLLVNVDAHKSLLAEIDQDFDKNEAVVLYEKGENFMDRYTAIKEMKRAKDEASLKAIESALEDDFWKIRETALENSKYLIREKKESLLPLIKKMALEDEKSAVRSEAFNTLSKYYEEEVPAEFLKKGLEDKSYRVVSNSLDALYEIDAKDGIEEAKKLESADNSGIKLAIANIYAEDGDPAQLEFFQKAVDEMSGFNLYPLLASYGNYLEAQDAELIQKAIPSLQKVAKNENAWFVRMSGVNAIAQLKKKFQKKADEIETEIQDEESTKDPAKLKAELEEAQSMVDQLQNSLKEIRKGEENENLLRIIDSNLN
ncbi:MAG: M1 family aminopeptidase [Vicingaceae bacterium]